MLVTTHNKPILMTMFSKDQMIFNTKNKIE